MEKKEEFKLENLNQLDRIEYSLAENKIEERNNPHLFGFFVIVVSFILSLLILVYFERTNLSGIAKAIYYNQGIMFLLFYTVIFAFVVDTFYWMRGNRQKKQLREEFFKEEVEK